MLQEYHIYSVRYYPWFQHNTRGYESTTVLCISHSLVDSDLNVSTLNAWGTRGGAVDEALRYKSERRGIDSRRCNWNFLLT
jgi:hypothetical protein